MTISFATDSTLNLIGASIDSIEQKNINLPNDLEAFDQEQRDLLASLAKIFGIDLDEAGYTLRVGKKDDGSFGVYTPEIVTNGSEVCIAWGNVIKPLSAIEGLDADLVTEGRPHLSFYIPSLDDSLQMSLKLLYPSDNPADDLRKDPKVQAFLKSTDKVERGTALRNAWKGKKLHLYLGESFSIPIKLDDLFEAAGAGEYQVTKYRKNRFGKHELFVSYQNAQGKTERKWVNGNQSIEDRLNRTTPPIISDAEPATLVLEASTKKTSKGNNIYPTKLRIHADKAIKPFVIGKPAAKVVETNTSDKLDFATV